MTADRENPGGIRETGDVGATHDTTHDTAIRDVGATHASPLPGLHNLKPYPTYKDSGVPWLGKVPAHWEVRRGKMLFQPIDVRSRTGEEELLTVSSERGVVPRASANVTMFKAESYVGYKLCWPDDLVINSLWAWARGLGVSRYHGIISSAYGVYRPLPRFKMHSQFVHNLVRSTPFQWELQVRSKGIWISRLQLTDEAFLGAPFPLPPLPEQTAIVRFLDHADRRIRRSIRAKQKLLALLEEQKQAIIHQAVTGQIDVRTGQPYPAYKPSGVEWLGDVPAHWEVAALRHRYSQCLGKMLDSKRITGNYLLPYLRNVDVQWDQVNIKDLPTMDIPPDEYERYTVQQGDLLVCEGGEVGRCALWSGDLTKCGFQKALHRLRPQNTGQDIPRFMHYVLRAAVKGNAFNDGHLSTIAHLTGDKLRAHRFPFPPVAEQGSLVSFLDTVLKQADREVSRIHHQIDLLREYRTRLIADVVTGKLDVREAAAALPEADPLAVEDELGDTHAAPEVLPSG